MKINEGKFLLHLFVGLLAAAPVPTRADEAADHSALRIIKAAYETAVNSGNPAALAPYLGEHTTGVMVTGDAVEGLQGLEAYWKKVQELIGPGGSYQVSVKVEKTDLLGDVAVSYGTTEDVIRLPQGRELRFQSHWTSVFQRQNDQWRIIRMQATLNPVTNVFVSALMQKTRLTYGIGGLIAGALSVLLVVRLRRRRS